MKNALLIIVCFISISVAAQGHHHSRNEVGISPGITYSPSHQNWGFGIHAHYFRTLSEHSPLSLGVSLEQVYAHGSHWTLGVGGKYEVIDRLNIAIMPGITFLNHHDEHAHKEEHDSKSKAQFSVHMEISYDLVHLEHFHLGPAIDYSWSKHDTHFMVGIHCAYGF